MGNFKSTNAAAASADRNAAMDSTKIKAGSRRIGKAHASDKANDSAPNNRVVTQKQRVCEVSNTRKRRFGLNVHTFVTEVSKKNAFLSTAGEQLESKLSVPSVITIPLQISVDTSIERSVRTILLQLRKTLFLDVYAVYRATEMLLVTSFLENKFDTSIQKNFARSIVRLGGIESIVAALKWWCSASNENLVRCSISILARVARYVETSRSIILDTGGVRSALESAKKHPLSTNVSVVMVILLSIVSRKTARMSEATTSKCIDYVIEVMDEFIDVPLIQRYGCEYFVQISILSSSKKVIWDKGLDILLLNIHANYHTDKATLEWIQKGMKLQFI